MKYKIGFFMPILLLICLFFNSGCEGDVSSLDEDAYGSLDTAAIAVSVEWPDDTGTAEDCDAAGIFDEGDAYGARMSAAPVTLSDNCAGRGVDKVRVEVQNNSGATLKSATFDCSAGQGTLRGIEPQPGCSIVVSGLNSAGTARYRGSKTNVTLHAGMNNVGRIQVERIDDDDPPDNGYDGDTVTNSIGMTFNYIRPGTFMMGSPSDEPGRIADRETQHQVTLTQGYHMQTTEVTQGQWKAVMGSNQSYFSNCGDDCPVESVSWNDVQNFITALNQREATTRYALPTEAQWEYAARAGSTTAFANGQITETGSGYDAVLDSMGWYTYNSNSRTQPVARKAPNAWGLYDMHGNVWEWVADWYGTYPTSAVTNPTGPSSGTYRVVRGGSWYNNARLCRSAIRITYYPVIRDRSFGFRLVLLPGH